MSDKVYPIRSHVRIRKFGGKLGETPEEKYDRTIENFEDILIYLKELRDDV